MPIILRREGMFAERDDKMTPPPIPTGVYRHFKGGHYQVIGVAEIVDTNEWVVVYSPLYGDDRQWVARPYVEFTGTVVRDGQELPRFQFLESIQFPVCATQLSGFPQPVK